ncbi:MAG: hypothetical protein PHQ25_05275 [Acidobacteriota bacterium]|nr:hypothetical protein [Acidobacteriota bacterium]MDW3229161.1 hypothetical protein [Acidobacteriota bacterium]MDY0231611.1 hypothetical protein [Candidatus Saccharicenans sp.]
MEQQTPMVPTPGTSGLQSTVTLGEWLVTLLIASIPVLNLIMLFVWAFGSNTKICKANWAKATLLWMVIVIVFYFLVVVLILGGLGFISHRF